MSEDTSGLDKAARLAAKEVADIEPPVRLEPEFPFAVVAFDSRFFGLESFASE